MCTLFPQAKDVSLDQSAEKCEKLETNITKLIKEKELNIAQIEKLHDYEKRTQELQSQTAIYTETISALQKDLIGEKINSEKLKTCLEKIGLNPNLAENDDLSIIIENILKNPEIANRITVLLKDRIYNVDPNESGCAKCSGTLDSLESDLLTQTEQVVSSISAEWNKQCEKLCSELTNMQQLNKQLQTENARMQVSIATLTSQVNSLTAQQTALQLANSQLVAEKEEVRFCLNYFLSKNINDVSHVTWPFLVLFV